MKKFNVDGVVYNVLKSYEDFRGDYSDLHICEASGHIYELITEYLEEWMLEESPLSEEERVLNTHGGKTIVLKELNKLY